MQRLNEEKYPQIESACLEHLMQYQARGLMSEGLVATASALQRVLATHGANEGIPHSYPLDLMMRAVTEALQNPVNKSYIEQKFDEAMVALRHDFQFEVRDPDQPEFPGLRAVGGSARG